MRCIQKIYHVQLYLIWKKLTIAMQLLMELLTVST